MSVENDKTLVVYEKMAQIHLDNLAAHDANDPERATRDFETFAKIIHEHNAKRGLY